MKNIGFLESRSADLNDDFLSLVFS